MSAPGTKHAVEDDGRLTYREIGERLGISHARVQQIEKRALEKLRKLILASERPKVRP